MSLLRQVAGNTAVLSFAQIVNPLTSILLVAAIARSIGAAGLGTYSLILAMSYMAASLGALGLARPISRAVAQDRDRATDYLGVCLAIGVGLGALAGLVMYGFAHAMGYEPEVVASAGIMAWAVVPSVLILHCEAIFLGLQRAKQVAAIAIAENTLKVLLGGAVLLGDLGIQSLLLVIAGLRLAAFVGYLVEFSRTIGPLSLRFHWSTAYELRRVSPIFTAGALISVVFGRLDLLILSALVPMADVGYYSAALRLIDIARLVSTSYMRAALPAMSEAFPGATATCRQLFRQGVALMGVFGAGAVLVLYGAGPFAVSIIYGAEFGPAESILRTLAPLLVPSALASVAGCLLLAAHLEFKDLLAQLLANLILAVGCFTLIPLWGPLGAAAAQTLGQTSFLVVLVLMLRRGAREDRALHNVLHGSEPSLAAPAGSPR